MLRAVGVVLRAVKIVLGTSWGGGVGVGVVHFVLSPLDEVSEPLGHVL